MDKYFNSSMGLERRKLSLINWISSLKDESLVKRIESIKSEESNWWDHISNEELAEIEIGLSQLNNGECRLHSPRKVQKEVFRATFRINGSKTWQM
jgi:hypothetical protein